MRIRKLAGLLCALTMMLAPAWRAPAQTDTPSPNIVIILADDLGYGDLSCYGHPTIRTPNIDRMAAQGIRLTSFYSAPSCSPSRAMLMTGRYSARMGIYSAIGPDQPAGLTPAEFTLAEGLHTKGYRTAAYGKWHLGHLSHDQLPLQNGFDEYFGFLYSNDMIRPWVQTDRPLHLYEGNEPTEEYPVVQETLTERYTQRGIEFIKKSKDEPFFLYLAYAMPHLPISASENFTGTSRAGLYGDVIETIDWSVGQILDTLKEEGLDENTLVIFASDNGPWLDLPARMLQGGVEPWHAGTPGLLRGSKASTYEGGVRVPLIARWPGRIPEGRISANMATLMDVYTTTLNLAGVTRPQEPPTDGIDIWRLLQGHDEAPRNEMFYLRGKNVEAVREGKWKLRISRHRRNDVPEGEEPSPELFDLDVDPGERYNRADDFPEIVTRLRARLDAFEI